MKKKKKRIGVNFFPTAIDAVLQLHFNTCMKVGKSRTLQLLIVF